MAETNQLARKRPPSEPDFDLDSFTPYRVAVAAQKLSEGLAKRYRHEFGISIPEWRVLVHVNHFDGVSVRDVEVRVAMEKSKVSRAATRLEREGYITKRSNDSDGRLIELHMTGKGRALMEKLLPMAKEHQETLTKILGEDFDAFEAGLDKLLKET